MTIRFMRKLTMISMIIVYLFFVSILIFMWCDKSYENKILNTIIVVFFLILVSVTAFVFEKIDYCKLKIDHEKIYLLCFGKVLQKYFWKDVRIDFCWYLSKKIEPIFRIQNKNRLVDKKCISKFGLNKKSDFFAFWLNEKTVKQILAFYHKKVNILATPEDVSKDMSYKNFKAVFAVVTEHNNKFS